MSLVTPIVNGLYADWVRIEEIDPVAAPRTLFANAAKAVAKSMTIDAPMLMKGPGFPASVVARHYWGRCGYTM